MFSSWEISVSELYFLELNQWPCSEAQLIIIDEYLDYPTLALKVVD